MSRRLTRSQAAEYLGVSEGFLRRHPPEKGGPPMLRIGRLVRYLPEDLDQWADVACRQETTWPEPAPEKTASSARPRRERTARRTPRPPGGSDSDATDASTRAARARQTGAALDAARQRSGLPSRQRQQPTLELVDTD